VNEGAEMSASSQFQPTPSVSAEDVTADGSLTVSTPAPPVSSEKSDPPPHVFAMPKSAQLWELLEDSIVTKGAPSWLQKLI
jgi:hypothetical protein